MHKECDKQLKEINILNRMLLIKIEDNTCMNCKIITQFASTKKRNVTINKELVEEVL